MNDRQRVSRLLISGLLALGLLPVVIWLVKGMPPSGPGALGALGVPAALGFDALLFGYFFQNVSLWKAEGLHPFREYQKESSFVFFVAHRLMILCYCLAGLFLVLIPGLTGLTLILS